VKEAHTFCYIENRDKPIRECREEGCHVPDFMEDCIGEEGLA